MYDEFEQAVTGKSRKGLSFLGWLSIALGTLFALGIVGVGLTAYYVRSNVAEIAHVLVQELEAGPAMAAAQVMESMESHTALLSAPPEEGVMLLQNLGSGPPAEAFMEDFFGGSLEIFPDQEDVRVDVKEEVREQIREGFLELKSEEGRVRMDLVRGDDGGSLIIDSDDGQVRFDLRKTDDGGFLSIDSDDGQVRFDLVKSDDGGSLIINSEEGEVRFDVKKGDTGGSLVIRSDEGVFRFGAGEEADGMPRWVPRADGMPSNPERVYSLTTDEGYMGAVAWQSEFSPQDIISFYRDWLEGEGFDLRAENRKRGESRDQWSLWARHEDSGRVVFLVGAEDAGTTRILLGYGEEQSRL